MAVKLFIVVSVCLSVLLNKCSNSTQSFKKIEIRDEQPWTGKYETLLITKDSAFFSLKQNKNNSIIHFKLSKQELLSIDSIIKVSNLNKIKSTYQKTYDRGGSTLIIVGENTDTISNAGSYYLNESHLEIFNKCLSFIKQTTQHHYLLKQAIKTDEWSMKNFNLTYSLNTDSTQKVNNAITTIYTLPGINDFYFTANHKNDVNQHPLKGNFSYVICKKNDTFELKVSSQILLKQYSDCSKKPE